MDLHPQEENYATELPKNCTKSRKKSKKIIKGICFATPSVALAARAAGAMGRTAVAKREGVSAAVVEMLLSARARSIAKMRANSSTWPRP